MEEQKNNNSKIIIIIVAVLGGLLLLGIIAICIFFLLTGALWTSVKKNINEQWEEISNDNNQKDSQWEDVTIEKDDSGKIIETKLEKTIDGKTVVYFFRGEGCSHCAEAEAWFESIKEEYGKYFIIKDYETWYNSKNAELMEEVAKSRGEEANGVPYIIIGDKSWLGFATAYESEMLNEIKRVYELY